MGIINEDVTERMKAIAWFIDSIANLHNSGLISHERAFELSNLYLDQAETLVENEGEVNG